MEKFFYRYFYFMVAILGIDVIFFSLIFTVNGQNSDITADITYEIPAPSLQPTSLWERGYAVIPTPRNVDLQNGEFEFGDDWSINLEGVDADDIAVDFLKHDLKTFHDIEITANSHRIIFLKVRPGTVKTGKKQEVDHQAYLLQTDAEKIFITGNSLHGLFYGIQTFLQLIKTKEDGRKIIPECTIKDWPEVELRILHWDTKNHQDRIETLKRYLDWSARFKVNAISFEIWDKFTFPSHPVIGAPGAFTPEQMQEIIDYGLERHIQVIPNVQAPSHFVYVLKHPEYAYLRGGIRPLWEGCICDERLYDLVFDMYNDLIKCTKGVTYFYASSDELFTVGSCPKCKTPYNPVNRSKYSIEFINKADNYLRSKGRRTIAWLEFPMLTEHVKLINPGIIDGVGQGHLGYFTDDDEFISEENKQGIQLINYVAIQGGEKFFPNYFTERGKGNLKSAFQGLSYGRTWQGDVVGTFTAAWDDSGLHNETFWLGWATGAQYSWTPGTPSVEQTASEFMKIYYGPKVIGMVDIYKSLQRGAQFWDRSWDKIETRQKAAGLLINGVDWGGREHKSYVGQSEGSYLQKYTLNLPELPKLSKLEFKPGFNEKYIENLEMARELLLENDKLIYNIHENLSRAERNGYNLRVLLSIADFERHHMELLLGLSRVENLFRQAEKSESISDSPLAIHQLTEAKDEIQRIIEDRKRTFQNLKEVFEISRYPKGRSVGGKDYVHMLSFYFADLRPDLSFMTAPEEELELEKYLDKLTGIIREYGGKNNLEGFYN
jgi:hexosaminidase